eukprot:TRINITY_DN5294_c0_g1_i3.p1 TRINITY_DN5294_c0_g1~~TRINITY_DN5294_c0_g1_i3.p1  ORF type:complete len:452 (-),score=99.42 TRINITY_DN5294_c0_g1_i3:103-1458(-)
MVLAQLWKPECQGVGFECAANVVDALADCMELTVNSSDFLELENRTTDILNRFVWLIRLLLPGSERLAAQALASVNLILVQYGVDLDEQQIVHSTILEAFTEVVLAMESHFNCLLFVYAVRGLESLCFHDSLCSQIIEAGVLAEVLRIWKMCVNEEREKSITSEAILDLLSKVLDYCRYHPNKRTLDELEIVEAVEELARFVDVDRNPQMVHRLLHILCRIHDIDRMKIKQRAKSADFVIGKLRTAKCMDDAFSETYQEQSYIRLDKLMYQIDNFVPSPVLGEVMEFYRRAISPFCCSDLVANLIGEYASEGYAIGQQVDVYGDDAEWLAAEVVGFQGWKIRVRYIGWELDGRWIEIPSRDVAPPFTHTKVPFLVSCPSSHTFDISDAFIDLLEVIIRNEPSLGTPSRNEVHRVAQKYSEHYEDFFSVKQNVIHHFRIDHWMGCKLTQVHH